MVGQGRWHNFFAGLVPHERVVQLFMKQAAHYGQARCGGVPYLCIAVLGDNFLTTQVRLHPHPTRLQWVRFSAKDPL